LWGGGVGTAVAFVSACAGLLGWGLDLGLGLDLAWVCC